MSKHKYLPKITLIFFKKHILNNHKTYISSLELLIPSIQIKKTSTKKYTKKHPQPQDFQDDKFRLIIYSLELAD